MRADNTSNREENTGWRRWGFALPGVIALGLLVLLAGCDRTSNPETHASTSEMSKPFATQPAVGDAAPVFLPDTNEQESWLRLDALPEDATSLQTGGEIYRLVCSTCHGDRGQGLTQEWIERVEPTEKGCWESKCHSANHPPDGFEFPRHVPPVQGPHMASTFATALDLYNFVRVTMPYHAPNSLTDVEYQYVTLYLLYLNGVEMEGMVLTPEDFAKLGLQ